MEQDLYQELNGLIKQLDFAVSSLRKSGADYAQAYHDYRVSLSQELVQRELDGRPATTSLPIVRGLPHVALNKFKEQSTEAVYKANLEAINATKLKIRVVENQIAREYSQPQGL